MNEIKQLEKDALKFILEALQKLDENAYLCSNEPCSPLKKDFKYKDFKQTLTYILMPVKEDNIKNINSKLNRKFGVILQHYTIQGKKYIGIACEDAEALIDVNKKFLKKLKLKIGSSNRIRALLTKIFELKKDDKTYFTFLNKASYRDEKKIQDYFCSQSYKYLYDYSLLYKCLDFIKENI